MLLANKELELLQILRANYGLELEILHLVEDNSVWNRSRTVSAPHSLRWFSTFSTPTKRNDVDSRKVRDIVRNRRIKGSSVVGQVL